MIDDMCSKNISSTLCTYKHYYMLVAQQIKWILRHKYDVIFYRNVCGCKEHISV